MCYGVIIIFVCIGYVYWISIGWKVWDICNVSSCGCLVVLWVCLVYYVVRWIVIDCNKDGIRLIIDIILWCEVDINFVVIVDFYGLVVVIIIIVGD